MDNEELKKKIEDILEEYNFETDDGEGWVLDTEEIADALITAGVGDVKKAEHRAEVAEKMFDILHEESSMYMKVFSKEWYKQQAEKELSEERKKL